ncbi:MAG: Flp pilus assembly complex ATPase component TadA [Candidatus Omnitrophica bacterium]|nr:Flp pilus assembly complex ATPase component TadA [Candidatus Omnitrophota bacterium]
MPPPDSVPSAVRSTSERLIDGLVSRGLLQRADLERVVQLQKERGGSLSQLLVEMGVVDSRALVAALSQILRIPSMALSKMELDPELGKAIPRKLAFQYQIVPVSRLGSQLTVAMGDPLNVLALDHLSQATGLTLTPLVAPWEEIQDALRRLYGGAMVDTLEELQSARGIGSGRLEVLSESPGSPAERVEELVRLTEQVPIVRVTNVLLTQGVLLKASDILVEPFEKRLRIRYRVDGVFREGESPPAAMHTGVISRLKVMSNLNIAEHRLPQDGRIKFGVEGRSVDFRVSVIPTYYGEKICLRILDKNQVVLDIGKMGFETEPLEKLKTAIQRPHGMVLITGPTGSGKTTTMYALLKQVDRPEKNLVTVEDPVEYDLPGVNQVAIRPDIGLTFAAALRSILRQDPNVIMVGEIRDAETAQIAVKAALTGHLVLSTLHANDAVGAVARLVNMGIEPYLIAASVLLVGAQRLPRKVCPRCQKAVQPPAELLKSYGLPAQGSYRAGKGCAECRRTGLDGRIGLLEAVPLSGEIRRLVAAGASSVQLRDAARTAGFPSLRDHAVAKAAAGVIPLEEVARTTVGYQE